MPRLSAGQSAWPGEIRRLSALFVGVPSLFATRLTDLPRLQEVVSAFQEALYRHEGSVNKVVVDGTGTCLIGAFGLPPLAQEDDAYRALLAAALGFEERGAGAGVERDGAVEQLPHRSGLLRSTGCWQPSPWQGAPRMASVPEPLR